jgi:hypothetical protein
MPKARPGHIFVRDFVKKLLAVAMLNDAAKADADAREKNPALGRLREARKATRLGAYVTRLFKEGTGAVGSDPTALADTVIKALATIEKTLQLTDSTRNWALLLDLMPESKKEPEFPALSRDPLLKLLLGSEDSKLNLQSTALSTLGAGLTDSPKIPVSKDLHDSDSLLTMLAGCRLAEGGVRSLERTTPADKNYAFDTIGMKTPKFGEIEITETPANTPLRIAFFFGFSRGMDADGPGAEGFASLGPSAWESRWAEEGRLPRETAWRAFAGVLHVNNETETEYWGESVDDFVKNYCSVLQSDGLLWVPKNGALPRRRASAGGQNAAQGDRPAPEGGPEIWVLRRPTAASRMRGGAGDLDYLQKHVHLNCNGGLSRDGVHYGFIEALAEFVFSRGLSPTQIANFAARPEPLLAPGVGAIIISLHRSKPLTFLIRRGDNRPLPNAMLFANANEKPSMFELLHPVNGGTITLRLIARASDVRRVDSAGEDANAPNTDGEDALHRVALINLVRLSDTGQQVDGESVPRRMDDAVVLDDGAFVFGHEDEAG